MSALHGLPPSICVRVTRRCNAACAFCQAPDTDRSVISGAELDAVCRWFRSSSGRSVKLSGGEPTVRADLPELIGVAARRSLKVTVITNGIVLRPAVLEALAANRAELKFSIHHPGERNDLALGRPSFAAVLGNLRRARQAGVPCAVNTVVSRTNRRELADMASFARDEGCRKVTFILFVPRGRGLANRERFELTGPHIARLQVEIDELASRLRGEIDVRHIDIRRKPYWIVENDMALVVESWLERADRVVYTPDQFRTVVGAQEQMTYGRPIRIHGPQAC
jgi:molybdenum cofactor biosynthesis enzyme MoaA